jgi:hypothetical protein
MSDQALMWFFAALSHVPLIIFTYFYVRHIDKEDSRLDSWFRE